MRPRRTASRAGWFCGLLIAVVPGLALAQDATFEESLFWESVLESGQAADVRAYLDRYPAGAFAPLARTRLGLADHGEIATPCDLMAADPDDPERVVKGVTILPENLDLAREVCRRALARDEGNRRLLAQLARIDAERGAYPDAIEAYRIAASGGSAIATLRLGELLTDEETGMADAAEAFGWLRLAADAGLAEGQYLLGRAFLHGDGTEADEAEALRLITLAADQGHAEAAFYLARYHHYIDNDLTAERRRLRQAELGGNPFPSLYLAAMMLDGAGGPQDVDGALERIYLGLSEGIDLAHGHMGRVLELGLGMPEDLAGAVRHYRLAPEDMAEARIALAGMLADGRGTEPDPASALEIYRQWHEEGNADATFGLAGMIEQGRGVAADPAAALALYREAAEGGSEAAARWLARLEPSPVESPRPQPRSSALAEQSADQDTAPTADAPDTPAAQEGAAPETGRATAVAETGIAEDDLDLDLDLIE